MLQLWDEQGFRVVQSPNFLKCFRRPPWCCDFMKRGVTDLFGVVLYVLVLIRIRISHRDQLLWFPLLKLSPDLKIEPEDIIWTLSSVRFRPGHGADLKEHNHHCSSGTALGCIYKGCKWRYLCQDIIYTGLFLTGWMSPAGGGRREEIVFRCPRSHPFLQFWLMFTWSWWERPSADS